MRKLFVHLMTDLRGGRDFRRPFQSASAQPDPECRGAEHESKHGHYKHQNDDLPVDPQVGILFMVVLRAQVLFGSHDEITIDSARKAAIATRATIITNSNLVVVVIAGDRA